MTTNVLMGLFAHSAASMLTGSSSISTMAGYVAWKRVGMTQIEAYAANAGVAGATRDACAVVSLGIAVLAIRLVLVMGNRLNRLSDQEYNTTPPVLINVGKQSVDVARMARNAFT